MKDAFPQFSRFPVEVQLLVWEAALHGTTRDWEIEFDTDGELRDLEKFSFKAQDVVSAATPIPLRATINNIRKTCSQSHKIVLDHINSPENQFYILRPSVRSLSYVAFMAAFCSTDPDERPRAAIAPRTISRYSVCSYFTRQRHDFPYGRAGLNIVLDLSVYGFLFLYDWRAKWSQYPSHEYNYIYNKVRRDIKRLANNCLYNHRQPHDHILKERYRWPKHGTQHPGVVELFRAAFPGARLWVSRTVLCSLRPVAGLQRERNVFGVEWVAPIETIAKFLRLRGIPFVEEDPDLDEVPGPVYTDAARELVGDVFERYPRGDARVQIPTEPFLDWRQTRVRAVPF